MTPRRDETQERTYPPTSLRLREARERGRVPRSRELTAGVTLLAALGVLALTGRRLLVACLELLRTALGGGARTEILAAAGAAALAAAPLMLCVVIAAVAGALIQTRGAVNPSAGRPDPGRLGLGGNLRRMFSARSTARVPLTLLKLAGAGLVVALMLTESLPELLAATTEPPAALVARAAALTLRTSAWLVAALLAPAAADYLLAWREHRRSLYMTRQEYLEDLRRMEADPELRKRRRREARSPLEGEVSP